MIRGPATNRTDEKRFCNSPLFLTIAIYLSFTQVNALYFTYLALKFSQLQSFQQKFPVFFFPINLKVP